MTTVAADSKSNGWIPDTDTVGGGASLEVVGAESLTLGTFSSLPFGREPAIVLIRFGTMTLIVAIRPSLYAIS